MEIEDSIQGSSWVRSETQQELNPWFRVGDPALTDILSDIIRAM